MGPNPVFFDIDTLAPTAPPRALVGQQGAKGFMQAAHAVPGGRFVAYSGQLLVDAPGYDQSLDAVTALHDLRHPLTWAHRPLATLTRADLAELSAWLEGRPTAADTPEHTPTADEREVLGLVRDAAEVAL